MTPPPIIIACHGLCEPINPGGVVTYGFVVYSVDHDEQVSQFGFVAEGEGCTNNTAAYSALIRAIAWLWRGNRKTTPVMFHTSSSLIVNQLNGTFHITAESIRPYYDRTKRGLAGLSHYTIEYVPRIQNERAAEIAQISFRAHVRHHGETCVGF